MSNSSTATSVRHTHAWLVTGGTQERRSEEALRRAAAVLCPHAKTAADPCALCPPCRKTGARLHPDVLFLSPGGASPMPVEAVRALRRGLRLAPNEAQSRVVIVEDAAALGVPAQNALLAALEEGGDVFFLLAERPDVLLPTVRSRCALLRLPTEETPVVFRADAGELMAAAQTGSPWPILRRCYALSRLKREEFALFLDALHDLAGEELKRQMIAPADGRKGGLTPSGLSRLMDTLRQMRARLTQNVSPAHMCGRLAALLTEDGQGEYTPPSPW